MLLSVPHETRAPVSGGKYVVSLFFLKKKINTRGKHLVTMIVLSMPVAGRSFVTGSGREKKKEVAALVRADV